MTTTKLIDYEFGVPEYKYDSISQLNFIREKLGYIIKTFMTSDKMKLIHSKIGIKTKNTCVSPNLDNIEKLFASSLLDRAALYKQKSYELVYNTVERLFHRIDPNSITHVIAVSCTGTYAPFIQDRLANDFNLNRQCKRIGMQYMGCHAGVKALDLAHTYANEEEGNNVLVVCIELCSLHMYETTRANINMDIIANMLFADGCACYIVSSDKSNIKLNGLEIIGGMSYHIPDSVDNLTWNLGKQSFVMGMKKEIIDGIKNHLPAAINDFNLKFNISDELNDDQKAYIVHPGISLFNLLFLSLLK
jgi:predicted naringenin-chalcone synthase